jgi:hypothetical protein
MWRSDTITDHRYKQAFKKLEKWARRADRLDADHSTGPVTARAVGVMRELDHEIHAKTKRSNSLDDVVRLLVASRQKLNIERFREAVVKVMGEPADALTDKRLEINADGKR